MRQMGLQGVSRRRKVFTTRPDPDALRAPDLVKRNFSADRPDASWVAIHVCEVHRTARRDRGPTQHRHRRRLPIYRLIARRLG
jgi:transposase InsO family protein